MWDSWDNSSWNDQWNSWGQKNNNSQGSTTTQSSTTSSMSDNKNPRINKLPMKEREEVIKQIFRLIFGKEPTPNELSKYKYSLYTKLELIELLLKGENHKKMLDKAKKFDEVNLNKEHLEQKVEILNHRLRSLQKELEALEEILAEKNKHIHQLREHINSMYEKHLNENNILKGVVEPIRSMATPNPKEIYSNQEVVYTITNKNKSKPNKNNSKSEHSHPNNNIINNNQPQQPANDQTRGENHEGVTVATGKNNKEKSVATGVLNKIIETLVDKS